MMYADSNEPGDIIAELGIAGVPVEVSKLKVGDYVIGPNVLERKSSNDFYQSIYDRRIFNQLSRLNSLEDQKPILCIHGPFPPSHKWIRLRGRSVKLSLSKDEKEQKERTGISVLSTAIKSYPKVSIILLKNQDQFVNLLVDLYYRQTVKAKKPNVKMRAESLQDIKFNIYCQVPGVGSKGALSLAKSDNSIVDISKMSIEDLCETFSGVGKKRAEWILRVFNT